MTRTWWVGRWMLAGLVAAAIATWPLACARGSAVENDRSDAKAERANFDFTLKDMHGKEVRLADFKGKPLIINFWATWCGPCKTEIPAFVELVEKYREQDLTILGISTDDPPEDLQKFAAAYKMNYPVLVGVGHEDLMEAYGASVFIPVSWFVKPDGTVHVKHSGPASKQWFEEQVKALF
jgi:cytochrome c biogenesis protein CcmG/thiol:disulfide interchange protein DsbE